MVTLFPSPTFFYPLGLWWIKNWCHKNHFRALVWVDNWYIDIFLFLDAFPCWNVSIGSRDSNFAVHSFVQLAFDCIRCSVWTYPHFRSCVLGALILGDGKRPSFPSLFFWLIKFSVYIYIYIYMQVLCLCNKRANKKKSHIRKCFNNITKITINW